MVVEPVESYLADNEMQYIRLGAECGPVVQIIQMTRLGLR